MKKKERRVAYVFGIVVIAIAAIVAYAVISEKPPEWQLDARVSNSGHQDTTELMMNNTWRIVWVVNKQSDNMFIVAVYMKNATGYSWLTDMSEEDTNSTQGVLPLLHTGTFVIRVIASDDTQWTLFIEELKPS
jgi:hypothetical protein